jgi:hypothetical protein
MKLSFKASKALTAVCTGVLGLAAAMTLSNCNQADNAVAAVPETSGSQTRITAEAQPATRVPESRAALEKTAGAATYLHFGDRTACQWNPTICSSSMVFWPGYIQSTGANEWGYVWMSNGPWTAGIGFNEPQNEASHHYHIIGLWNPAQEANPAATAMWGNWWMWVTMKRGNAQVNFDLTQINVVSAVPVRIWYKDAAGRGYQWSSLGKGRWNLPGATNIQEVHISSASGAAGDRFIVDDIRVTSR